MNKRLNPNMCVSAARKIFIAVLVGIAAGGAVAGDIGAAVSPIYQYHLSSFNGPVSVSQARIYLDKYRKEVYVLDPHEKDIRVFNDRGMQVFHFGNDHRLGTIVDVAVKKDGNILLLSKNQSNVVIVLCDFRGEPLTEWTLKGVPPDFSGFFPDGMALHQERLYLLDSISMRVVVTSPEGAFLKGYDLAALLEIDEHKRSDNEVGGFSVDPKGNILFTVPVLFAAFVLSPEGTVKSFGQPGSAPGKFGNVRGIVADARGNYYVADQLKCVVNIFDENFRFQKQFGYRGARPHNLIAPQHLGMDDSNRLYVSQLGKRGVSVFKIAFDAP